MRFLPLVLLLVPALAFGQIGKHARPSRPASPVYENKTLIIGHPSLVPATHHHDQMITNADDVVDLSYSTFRWDQVKQNDSNDSYSLQLRHAYTTGSFGDTWPNGNGDTRYHLFWIDFETIFDNLGVENPTIVSAKLCVIPSSNWWLGGSETYAPQYLPADSLFCTLLAGATDGVWKTNASPTHDQTYTGAASWDYQTQGYDLSNDNVPDQSTADAIQADNYPQYNASAWSPALVDRAFTWDFGKRSRGLMCPNYDGVRECGVSYGNVTYTIDQTNPWIDLTRIVQGVLSYDWTNNGCTLPYLDSSDSEMWFYHWETNAAASTLGGAWYDHVPFMLIEYNTRPYEAPYPYGSEVAFTFVSDDGVLAANDAWTTTFAANNVAYTIAISETQRAQGTGGDEKWDYDDLVRWRNSGMEIASHSRWHMNEDGDPNNGLCEHDWQDYGSVVDYVRGMDPGDLTPGTDTGYDSLLCDMDPIWIYEGMATSAGVATSYYENDPYVAKTLALPFHQYNLSAVLGAVYHGYLGLRGDTDNWNYPRTITQPTAGDTMRAFSMAANTRVVTDELDYQHKINGLLTPLFVPGSGVWGDYNDPPSAAELEHWAKWMIERAATKGRNGHIVLYTHDLPRASGSYAPNGVSAASLGTLIFYLKQWGGVWIAPLGDVQRWKRTRGTAVADPGWSNAAWDFSAADGVWLDPPGIWDTEVGTP